MSSFMTGTGPMATASTPALSTAGAVKRVVPPAAVVVSGGGKGGEKGLGGGEGG